MTSCFLLKYRSYAVVIFLLIGYSATTAQSIHQDIKRRTIQTKHLTTDTTIIINRKGTYTCVYKEDSRFGNYMNNFFLQSPAYIPFHTSHIDLTIKNSNVVGFSTNNQTVSSNIHLYCGGLSLDKSYFSRLNINTPETDTSGKKIAFYKSKKQGGSIEFTSSYADTIFSDNIVYPISITRSDIKLLDITCFDLTVTDSKIDTGHIFFSGKSDTCRLNYFNSRAGRKLLLRHATFSSGSLTLIFNNTNINQIDFDLSNTVVVIDKNQKYEVQIGLYQQLLKLYNDNGYTEKYEIYDKQFQELKYLYNHHPIFNFISKYWWDYGYDKVRVCFIALLAYVIFTFINVAFYHRLTEVYWPKKFGEYHVIIEGRKDDRRKFKRVFYSLDKGLSMALYTAYIFWGVKLNIEEITLKYRLIVFLLLTQYIFGLICIGYIANFILTK